MAAARGAWRGRVRIAEDFNELPADIVRALGADAPPDALEIARRLVEEYEAQPPLRLSMRNGQRTRGAHELVARRRAQRNQPR